MLARLALALFLSAVLGILLYAVTLPIVQSLAGITDINFPLFGVLAIGTGAGIGSYLGWLNRNLNIRLLVLVLFR